jgi:thymidylate synthase ThyX
VTTISAKVIAHSVHAGGQEICSMQLRYPRPIHGEFMTHRVFSRNASSSRAVPVPKLIEDIRRDPFVPLYWGRNQPGMQAGEDHNALVGSLETREERWLRSMEMAIEAAEDFHRGGYHKQIVNRLLEPFSHINVLVTADEWDNFFELRDHPDAEPHIQALARAMKEAMKNSKPKLLGSEEWHLPYVTSEDRTDAVHYMQQVTGMNWPSPDRIEETLIKVSVARCARVSYLTHEGKAPNFEEDMKLYERLVGGVPLHASPAEHQACPGKLSGLFTIKGKRVNTYEKEFLHGNFTGWQQYRQFLQRGRSPFAS